MSKQQKGNREAKNRKQLLMELRNKRKIPNGMMALLQGYLVIQNNSC